jgi:hypothetical protein
MADVVLLKARARNGAQVSQETSDLAVVFDATLSDSYSRSASVTDHPLEDATTVSDHVVREPGQATISGVLTRTTLGTVDPESPTRVDDALDRLDRLITDGQPVSIVTGLRSLVSYVVTGLTVSRSDPSQGQAPRVQLTLKELVTAASQVVQIPPERVAAAQQDGATAQSDQGTATPTESEGTEVKAEVNQSLAQRGFNFISGR